MLALGRNLYQLLREADHAEGADLVELEHKREVERLGGSLETLKEAERLHQSDGYRRMPLVIKEHTPRTIELSSRVVKQVFRRWTYPSYHWLY